MSVFYVGCVKIEIDVEIDVDQVCDVWETVLKSSSSLPSSLLSSIIPLNELMRIVVEFYGEYNGINDVDEFEEFDIERVIEIVNTHKNLTYRDLNEWMRLYLLEFVYNMDVMREDLKNSLNDGDEWDESKYLWINNVISHYISSDELKFYGVDADE